MTPAQWITGAQPNDQLVYFTSSCMALSGGGRASKEARELYDSGLVDLVQRRIAGGRFEYIAVKRKVPAKIPLEHSFAWMEEHRYAA